MANKIIFLFLIHIERLSLLFSTKYYILIHSDQYKSSFNPLSLELLFGTFYQLCRLNGSNLLITANKILDNKLILFGTEFNINNGEWLKDPLSKREWDKDVFFYNAEVEKKNYGDVKYVMEYNKMYHLVDLALAYHKTLDIKYIKKIEEDLKSWINTVRYERGVVNKIMMDIAFRCLNLVYVSILCIKCPYFMHNVMPVVLGILFVEEKQIRRFSTPRWFKYNTGTNHTIGEMVGLIVTQLWLEQFTLKSYKHSIKKEFGYLNHCLLNIITSKGVYLEQSAGYSRLAAEFLIILDIFVKVFDNEGIRLLYKQHFTISILDYIDCLSYHGHLPNFGDNDGSRAVYSFAGEGNNVSHLLKYKEIINQSKNGILKNNGLICYESGQFIWKSNDKKDVYIFTRAGRHGFMAVGGNSHSHNDILSLIVFAKGKELFIDRGTYLYNSGISLRNIDRKTASHNSLSIDNKEQAGFLDKWSYRTEPYAKIIDVELGNSHFVFEGECSYSGYTHVRKINYNKSNLIITDYLNLNEDESPVSINFLISPLLVPRLQKAQNIIDILCGTSVLSTIIFDNECKLKVEHTDYAPSYGIEGKTIRIVGQLILNRSRTLETQVIIY
ncbi:MAG: heparinase II/III-family protein [Bacteroidales bacterium]|nr:heparinase II/III-family protein [Bacteroidales bacterium]